MSDMEAAAKKWVDALDADDLAQIPFRSIFEAGWMAAVNHQTGASGWQPIETAPKDGKILLMWAATDIADDGSIMNWKMATGWWRQSPLEGESKWNWNGRELRSWDVAPTHWMPLPEPPASGGQS